MIPMLGDLVRHNQKPALVQATWIDKNGTIRIMISTHTGWLPIEAVQWRFRGNEGTLRHASEAYKDAKAPKEPEVVESLEYTSPAPTGENQVGGVNL